jgi:DNA invertase Pin-like site-specific DNA recombinase
MSIKAVSYLRTSSQANVGGDSDKRQRQAIQAYAAANDIETSRNIEIKLSAAQTL